MITLRTSRRSPAATPSSSAIATIASTPAPPPTASLFTPATRLRPELRGSTGYKGWQHPGHPHTFAAPRPSETPSPEASGSRCSRLARARQGLKALAANKIQAKDQNGLGSCWVYGRTRSVELRRVLEGLAHVNSHPNRSAAQSLAGQRRRLRPKPSTRSRPPASARRASSTSLLSAPQPLESRLAGQRQDP